MQTLLPRPERNGRLKRITGNLPYNTKTIEELVMPAKSLVLPRTTKLQSARLEARISPDLHLIVKRAAEIQGSTMTDFVIHALQIAAAI